MTSFSEAKRVVDEALDKKRLAVLVGECRVAYTGRAASKLSEGDRLLVIKPDGTFLVHQATKMTAINYQGPGSKTLAKAYDDCLCVVSTRRKPLPEKIEVCFTRVDFAGAFEVRDDKKLKVFGTERELSDLLAQDLDVIEPGLKPLKKESIVRKGMIDILAEDPRGHLVVIEVKRRSAGLDAVTQLHRYVKELRQRKGCVVRGVLCAPKITDNALKMLQKEGLEYRKLDYAVRNPRAEIKGLQKKQKELSAFEE